jgi:lysophospholipase L1-like esterase
LGDDGGTLPPLTLASVAGDDNLMDRFDATGSRRFRARDGIIAVLVAALVLLLVEGTAVHKAGEQASPGVNRDILLALGKPSRDVADALPLHKEATRLTAGLSPDTKLAGTGGFDQRTGAVASGQIPPVTPDAFSAAQLGTKAPPRRALHTLLVTGDSLSTPLDLSIARRLTGRNVKVVRDPHLGAGISKTDLVDWGRLAVTQMQHDKPDAVVVWIGANEGFPMKDPRGRQQQCCSAQWAAIYANRVRQVMNTYRRAGATHVYWLTVLTPREAARHKISRVVNAAVEVAAQPWRDQVSILDTIPIFTPGDRYRDSMPIGGTHKLVRESDGIHLNATGANYLAGIMLNTLRGQFTF